MPPPDYEAILQIIFVKLTHNPVTGLDHKKISEHPILRLFYKSLHQNWVMDLKILFVEYCESSVIRKYIFAI